MLNIKKQIYIDGVPTMVLQSKLTRKIIGQDEEGNDILGAFYRYYNSDMGIDLVSELENVDNPIAEKEQKEHKISLLDNLVVTVYSVKFDAHEEAMGNMSNVANVATKKYNKLVAEGTSPVDAYDAIYKSTIPWKGADNKVHTVQIETIVEALEKAMEERAKIYGAM